MDIFWHNRARVLLMAFKNQNTTLYQGYINQSPDPSQQFYSLPNSRKYLQSMSHKQGENEAEASQRVLESKLSMNLSRIEDRGDEEKQDRNSQTEDSLIRLARSMPEDRNEKQEKEEKSKNKDESQSVKKYEMKTKEFLLNELEADKFTQYLRAEMEKTETKKEQFFSHGSRLALSRNDSELSRDSQYTLFHPLQMSRKFIPNFSNMNQIEQREEVMKSRAQFQKAAARLLSKEEIVSRLEEIYHYYSESYLQPLKKYDTFDAVSSRAITFQSFYLFCKDFKILKVIYKVDRLKQLYKKYANYGKVLKEKNFLSLIEAMAHQQEARKFFKFDPLTAEMSHKETRNQLENMEFYRYLGIHTASDQWKDKFSKVFNAFNCEKDVDLPKISNYKYRRFSEADLHKKAIKEKPEVAKKKNVVVVRANEKFEPSPFEQAKSIVISWQMLRSKSVAGLNSLKHSAEAVKKYVKEDPEDKLYLKEYIAEKRSSQSHVGRILSTSPNAVKGQNGRVPSQQADSRQREIVEQKIKEIRDLEQNKKKHSAGTVDSKNNIISRMDQRISQSRSKLLKIK